MALLSRFRLPAIRQFFWLQSLILATSPDVCVATHPGIIGYGYPMNNEQNTPMWKKALKWIALTLVSVVVLDWLLDGRLRERLPLRKSQGPK